MIPVFLIGAFNVWNGYNARVEFKPGYFSLGRASAIGLISGVCSMAVAVLVLALDPHHRPLLQRLANAFWGGPIGAMLMGSARAVPGSTGTTRPAAVIAKAALVKAPAAKPIIPPPNSPLRDVPSSPSVAERLGDIEARLSALEQRR